MIYSALVIQPQLINHDIRSNTIGFHGQNTIAAAHFGSDRAADLPEYAKLANRCHRLMEAGDREGITLELDDSANKRVLYLHFDRKTYPLLECLALFFEAQLEKFSSSPEVSP